MPDVPNQGSNRIHRECKSIALMSLQPAKCNFRSIKEERYGKEEVGSGDKISGLAWRCCTNT
jgi:hypothetical protein